MEKQQNKSQFNMKCSGNLHEGNKGNEANAPKEAVEEKLFGKQECEFKISTLEVKIKQLENQLIRAEKNIEEYQEELFSVYTSRSWRYTALLRKMQRILCKIFSVFYKSFLRKLLKSLYLLLPTKLRSSNFIENLKNDIKDNDI